MNLELASTLARARHRDLLKEAADRRLLRRPAAPKRPLRARLGRAIAAFGYLFVALGESIAWQRRGQGLGEPGGVLVGRLGGGWAPRNDNLRTPPGPEGSNGK